jgi:transposase
MAESKDSQDATKRRRSGRPDKLSAEQVSMLREVALAHPHATIDDLLGLFAARSGVRLSQASMYRYLPKAGIKRVARAKLKAAQQNAPTTSDVPASPVTKQPFGYTDRHRDAGDATRYPASLTDAEWSLVADLFEVKGPGKPPRYPRRLMVDACCYVVRSGCPWRMLPKDFPRWQNVYAHFRRWTSIRLFERMHDRLRAMWREREKRDASPTAAIVDSQSVKTSPQGGPKGFDAGKKVKGRKRHIAVDTLGLLLAVLVLPANVQDRDGAGPVVERALAKYPAVKKLYFDSAYSGRCAAELRDRHRLDVEVVRRPSAAGAWNDAQLSLFAPPPPPFVILPKRWVVERTNSWIERPRRMAKDQDRRLDVAESWIWFVEARLLLRRFAERPVASTTAAAA